VKPFTLVATIRVAVRTMDFYQLVATVSLVLQIIVLGLLLGGYMLKRAKKFRYHGIAMLAAVVLHLTVIFALMIPSFFLTVIPIISANAASALALIAPFHAIIGIVAAVLGVWIVASWRLRTSLQYCTPKKRIMLVTFTLWVITLLLGILLYLHFYTTLLPL
jgi:uncharacterized membrane protein YozB (DUF420 family)